MGGCPVAQAAVMPLCVVPLGIGSDGSFRLRRVLEPVVPDAFSFERTNDPFGNGVSLKFAHISVGESEPEPFRVIHKQISGIPRAMVRASGQCRE
jgi:hypothetical protein